MCNTGARVAPRCVTNDHVFVLTARVTVQGAQGEPGSKGERGDPGLPVCTDALTILYLR